MATITETTGSNQQSTGSISQPDIQKLGQVASGDIEKASQYVLIASSALVAGSAFFEKDKMFSKKNKTKGKTKKKLQQTKQRFKEFKDMSFADKWKATKDYFIKNKTVIIGIASPFITAALLKIVSEYGGFFRSYEELIKEIENANVKQDIVPLRARISAARNRLTYIESNIQQIINFLDTLASVVEALTLIIMALELLMEAVRALVLAATPFPIIPGVITSALETMNKIQKVLDKILEISAMILLMIGVVLPILQSLLDKIRALKEKLDLIDSTLENPENLSRAIESGQNIGGITPGYLVGYDYNGYRFFIKEDPDPKFDISGHKRHFAVAVDRDGVEAFTSKYSYTTDPNVLVEELKLKIDSK